MNVKKNWQVKKKKGKGNPNHVMIKEREESTVKRRKQLARAKKAEVLGGKITNAGATRVSGEDNSLYIIIYNIYNI